MRFEIQKGRRFHRLGILKNRALFLRVKRLGREASQPSQKRSAEVRKKWRNTFTSAYVFIAWKGTTLLPLILREQIYGGNAYLPDIQFKRYYDCFVCIRVFLGLYGRSANVFRDGYSFRTLLCNTISNKNKNHTSNRTDFPRLYCELQ